jgi:aminopeptidase N
MYVFMLPTAVDTTSSLTQIGQLDAINPQVAARLTRRFDRWRRFDATRQGHARSALESLRAIDGLSSDVHEIVGRALD